MIPPNRHTREWITAQQARLDMADPIILEKAIFALTLLDLLGRTDLEFVFKGGTALLLHLPRPNRLSIDIDIVCNAPKLEFESALDTLISISPFLRWDEQLRGERGLPGRRHYRFHFQSPTQSQEMHILLDVVTEPNVLIHIVERPVNATFLEITETIAVKTPCLESLLADKLTAFAPGSVGVPLTAQFSQQVIKQLFDIAHVYWQHRMNLLKADARFIDVLELTLYDSAISGMSIKGNSYYYQNPLESAKGAERSEWIGLACCPTNHARFTPQVGGYVYAHADDQLFVNLFAAGEGTVKMNKGRTIKIAQQTNYPWDGQVNLTINPEKPSDFDLCVRIPGWALGKPVPSDLYRFAETQTAPVTLKVNGETVAATPGPDGYVHLKRSWKAGDRVELGLPMPVRRVLAHEKVAENKGKVALMRGPVVYCLEGVDNKDIDLFKLSLPSSAKLTAEHRADMLEGVTVVRTTGLDESRKPIQLTAIPYYAWANREKAPMVIWIKDSTDQP
jgi:Beta-L-arabinofuranosidase, GH127/Nucleotidyl transferase AbiEii toxin, Type IV TA system